MLISLILVFLSAFVMLILFRVRPAKPVAKKPDFDYKIMGEDHYDFMVENGWEPDDGTLRYFEHIKRKRRVLAEEQRRGVEQQKAMIARQRELDNLPIDGIEPQHPVWRGVRGPDGERGPDAIRTRSPLHDLYDIEYNDAADRLKITRR